MSGVTVPPKRSSASHIEWWRWRNQAWGVFGTLLLILILALAWSNLQEVVRSQQDFAVGSLLALVGFAYAKAWGSTVEERAIQFLREPHPPMEVQEVIDMAVSRHLDRGKGSRNVALLAEKVALVSEELQAHRLNRQQKIHLSDTIDPAMRASHHVAQMWPILDDLRLLMGERTNETYRLVKVSRDLGVAADRAQEVLQRIEAGGSPLTTEQKDIFSVLQKDISAAIQTLGVVQARAHQGLSVSLPPVHLYVQAALRRAQDFRTVRSHEGVTESQVFRIMVEDLQAAQQSLEDLIGS